MNIVGIVAEYNPFHKGHLYHLNTVKQKLKPDGIIVVLSGNFVQRGEPAIFNKWVRTEMALYGGADLVIELPVCFSTATAEIFAETAIKMLVQTKVVNTLSFGIEEYREKELYFLGDLLSSEPVLYKKKLNEYLKSGISFPSAREKAVSEYIKSANINMDSGLLSKLLKQPNLILAIEYIKAIKKLKANLSIFPVIRKGHGYLDKQITNDYASASAIRHVLLQRSSDGIQHIAAHLPDSTLKIIKREMDNSHNPIFLKDFEILILYALRKLSTSEIKTYFDINEGLENRIKKAAQSSSLRELISKIKTKRYPETRIQRILIHILLDIPEQMVKSRNPLYYRILGFTQKGSEILKEISKKAKLPIITRTAQYKKLDQNAKTMFEKDLLASDIYSLAYKSPELRSGASDFTRNIIIFDHFK